MADSLAPFPMRALVDSLALVRTPNDQLYTQAGCLSPITEDAHEAWLEIQRIFSNTGSVLREDGCLSIVTRVEAFCGDSTGMAFFDQDGRLIVQALAPLFTQDGAGAKLSRRILAHLAMPNSFFDKIQASVQMSYDYMVVIVRDDTTAEWSWRRIR